VAILGIAAFTLVNVILNERLLNDEPEKSTASQLQSLNVTKLKEPLFSLVLVKFHPCKTVASLLGEIVKFVNDKSVKSGLGLTVLSKYVSLRVNPGPNK
jgi:hypothetical protein